jgi:hypothetical protein
VNDDQFERLVVLLGEIRDRLPTPPEPVKPMMFGYIQGSGEYPSEGQYQRAKRFLRGDMGDGLPGYLPVLAQRIAREIVAKVEG